MNVFVTGSTGYIGGAVAAAFRRAGHHVFGLARSSDKARALAREEVVPVLGDLAEPESFLAVARGCDILVHCASEHSSSTVSRDRAAIDALLEAVRDAAAPRAILYTSGVWVYGDTGGRTVDETTPLTPLDLVRWRVDHEQRVLAATASQLRTLVLRPGCVYGGPGGLTALWFASALAGEAEMVGDGTNSWSTVHVADLANAYVQAAERAPGGEALNINDGTNPRVGEMVAAVAAAAGVPGRIRSLSPDEAAERFGPLAEGLAVHQKISNARAVAALGWHPEHTSFASEADLYLSAYRAHKG
ncbi:MAG: NAD-dependent epimerase/dehydratase family protein [Thermoanaerobaculia bacterium]